ncbi:hypothetical protein F2P81_025486 [Scophthalmus maximus]|uniref:Uncharacterized protein n=1 Tax=Scophthalmus maximus TaxID=52904 RepID=A0A6A4RSC5_SCOMX|nr:hypothetical protein F2P81_025486 [Scophthalmus maximus]
MVESQLVFIRDSLDRISDLYRHDSLSSVTWDTDTTHHFRMSVGKMIDGLNTCVINLSLSDLHHHIIFIIFTVVSHRLIMKISGK